MSRLPQSTRNPSSPTSPTGRGSPEFRRLLDKPVQTPNQREFQRLLNRPVDMNRRFKAALKLGRRAGAANRLLALTDALRGYTDMKLTFVNFRLATVCPVLPGVPGYIGTATTVCGSSGSTTEAQMYQMYIPPNSSVYRNLVNGGFVPDFTIFQARPGGFGLFDFWRWHIYVRDTTYRPGRPVVEVQPQMRIERSTVGSELAQALAANPALNPNDRRALNNARPPKAERRPQEQPLTNYGGQTEVSTSTGVRTNRNPFVMVAPRTQTEFFPVARPPGKEFASERKVRAPLHFTKKIWDVLGATSEAGEVVDCAFKNLPKAVQKKAKKAHKKKGDDFDFDSFGQYGTQGAEWKIYAVLAEFDNMDVEGFLKCVAENQVEDEIVGRMQGAKDAWKGSNIRGTVGKARQQSYRAKLRRR